MRLREFNAEIRCGNVLLLSCQGRKEDGSEHCCGMIRVPFEPPLPGCQLAELCNSPGYWKRTSGETVDDLMLRQSVDAGDCGHFNVTNGEIIRCKRCGR